MHDSDRWLISWVVCGGKQCYCIGIRSLVISYIEWIISLVCFGQPGPGGRGSSRGGNIDQNNNYENPIPPKKFVSCSCKKPKKNFLSKLIVWLDHFEPEDPKQKPRVPQIKPLSEIGGGVKKKGNQFIFLFLMIVIRKVVTQWRCNYDRPGLTTASWKRARKEEDFS